MESGEDVWGYNSKEPGSSGRMPVKVPWKGRAVPRQTLERVALQQSKSQEAAGGPRVWSLPRTGRTEALKAGATRHARPWF